MFRGLLGHSLHLVGLVGWRWLHVVVGGPLAKRGQRQLVAYWPGRRAIKRGHTRRNANRQTLEIEAAAVISNLGGGQWPLGGRPGGRWNAYVAWSRGVVSWLAGWASTHEHLLCFHCDFVTAYQVHTPYLVSKN